MSQPITTAIQASDLTVDSIDAGHISIGVWNGKTGVEAKFGTKHLYSEKYRERWPEDQFPEMYEKDEPVD